MTQFSAQPRPIADRIEGSSGPDLQRDLRGIAETILDNHGVPAPPVRMTELSAKFDYTLTLLRFPEKLAKMVGVLDHDRRRMVVDDAQSPEAQNITIARLFATDWLWANWGFRPEDANEEDLYLLRRDSTPWIASPAPPTRADILAAYILVPPIFLQEYRPFASFESLAALFVVTSDFLTWRLSLESA